MIHVLSASDGLNAPFHPFEERRCAPSGNFESLLQHYSQIQSHRMLEPKCVRGGPSSSSPAAQAPFLYSKPQAEFGPTEKMLRLRVYPIVARTQPKPAHDLSWAWSFWRCVQSDCKTLGKPQMGAHVVQ